MRKGIALFIILLTSIWAYTQDSAFFAEKEIQLNTLGKMILSSEADSIRVAANVEFYYALNELLNNEASWDYSFPELKSTSILIPEDSTIRIFTWNIPLRTNEILYYGFIQRKTEKGYKLYSLQDHSRDMYDIKHMELNDQNWYGCLYYDIVQRTANNRNYYTLLGWDGYTNRTTRKIIDVLWFDRADNCHFGAPLFPGFEQEMVQRVVFEYSKMASMTVRNDTQYISKIKRKQKIIRGEGLYDTILEAHDMIIFNRLMPLNEELRGQYEYYVPLGEIIDALIFENGQWIIHKEIDARYKYFDTIQVQKPTELNLQEKDTE